MFNKLSQREIWPTSVINYRSDVYVREVPQRRTFRSSL